jgi:hypothetical protein
VFFFLSRNIKGSFIVLLAIIPFENSITLLPSLSMMKICTIITFIAFTINTKDFLNFFIENVFVNRKVLLFGIVFVASTLMRSEGGSALQEAQGLLQLCMLIGITWYYVDKYDEEILSIERYLIIYGFVIIGLIVLAQGYQTLTQRLFLARFLGPNSLAVLYTAFAVIAYQHWSRTRSIKYGIALVIFCATVYLTGNRSIVFGFMVYIVVYLGLSMRKGKRDIAKLLISVASISAILFIVPFEKDSFLFNVKTRMFYSLQQVYEMVVVGHSEIKDEEQRYHTELYRSARLDSDIRGKLYSASLKRLKDNLYFGSGPGSHANVFTGFAGFKKDLHSNLNTIAVDYGLLGLAIFFFIIARLFLFAYNNIGSLEGKTLIVLLVLYFIDGLLHTNYQDGIIAVFLTVAAVKLKCKLREARYKSDNLAAGSPGAK